MSVELIRPHYLSASVQEICRGYPPLALQRSNGQLLLIGEDSDANSHLRHRVALLPVFHPLQSLNIKGFPKWLRNHLK